MSESSQQQRYRVVERLASGGMAEVFLAESAGIEGFKKQVAIKRVLPTLSEKKRFIAMFLDEARLSANLSHSNVAQVFDIGRGDSAYFIVMEYVDGADLRAVIDYSKTADKTIPVEAACFIAAKICEGLTYAHELRGTDGEPLQIVHRDITPANVLITQHGEVKIVDFGLAKATSQLEKSEAGMIKGKFSYLSPEAAQGREIDHRTDIFAVGIILWEMLSGDRLFVGESDFATVKLVQEAKIPSLRERNPTVTPELEAIILRALARDPAARYSTARDLGRDLTRFLFKYGKPIGAYDIAEFVREAVSHRKKTQPERVSIIDKLIADALVEFTSLQDDKPAPGTAAGKPASEPAKGGGAFEDIGNWADEIAVPAPAPATKSVAPKVEEGNLASLEDSYPAGPVGAGEGEGDDEEEPPPPSEKPKKKAQAAGSASSSTPPPASVRPKAKVESVAPPAKSKAPAPLAKAEDEDLAATIPKSGGSTTTILIVVAVLGALFAGLWFSGVIPH